MKTILQRGLSLVMCLILLCSTMSVMAFGANEEAFSYKTYAQNATKENVHYILDVADDALKDMNINETIDLKVAKININLTSIDAVCSTLDRFRGIINIAKGALGDLKDLNLKVFDEGMSRAKSGDVKIFNEVLELAAANGGIIEKLASGNLDLGLIAEALDIDLSTIKIGDLLKEIVVDAIFKDDPNLAKIKEEAMKDFDKFVYNDVMGLLSKEGGILEGVKINGTTTINGLLTNVFDLLLNKHVKGIIEDNPFNFEDLGADYAGLDKVINLGAFKGVTFTTSKTLLAQINDVLGDGFKQIVPGYTGWKKGNHTIIGSNMRGLVQYVAKNGLKINIAGKTDEQLMLEIGKIVVKGIDAEGAYIAVKDAKTLMDMVNKLLIHISKKSYAPNATYEHVLGDYIVEAIGKTIPLFDEKGKEITVGSGKTVWEVLNSVLNFFFVDKNLDSYFGLNLTKSSSFFAKLDLLLDFTADDGTANFTSETYFKALLKSVFTVDLQTFVNLTAVKASNFAGNTTVVKFLCNTANNLLKNWGKGSTLNKWSSFNSALSNENIANLVKLLIETINRRKDSAAVFVGVVYGAINNINENIIVSGKAPTCTANGYAPTKRCTKEGCVNPNFSDSGDVIPALGHHYDAGKITKNPTCTAKGIKTFVCVVCANKKYEYPAAKGHKATGYKTTKAATYKTKGLKVNKCTVCGATLGTQTINMLTLNKPTGLKSTALSTSSIKFSWKKVTGAESYTLYYRAGSGKWKAVNAKNKTSYTVKKLKTGTTYKFKVVAVAGSNKSKDSSIVSATTKPSAVTIKGARSSKKKEIIAEWKKLSGVTGYEVTYSTSKKFTKSTTKTVNIKKQSTYKTYIKKLKSKKTYYVKVRAYKTVNNVKVYGAYSKVKSVKCK